MSNFPQDKGRRFCEQHVYANQSVLVSELAALEYDSSGGLADEFSLSENCINYSEPAGFEDWRATECIAWLKENNVDEDRWPSSWAEWNDLTEGEREDFDFDIDVFSDDGEWRECVRNHWECPKVYEWYVVSDWFEYQLEAIGEVILKNSYGSWWGRQAGGQAIYMDEYLWPIFEKWFGED